jgi:carbon-monoxide dehydrogenase small subunit/xanthine dehydrogenase small subunit
MPVAQAEDTDITTIEGLEGEHRLQEAFIRHGAAQCGICTPGMIMAALNLPPKASLEQIKTALAGNICRCTGYEAIYRAIQDA